MAPDAGWRDAVVRTLALDRNGGARPGARLLRYDPDEVALLLPHTGEPLVVRTADPSDPDAGPRLQARLAELRKAARSAHVSVLLLGGGPAEESALREGASTFGGRLLLMRADEGGRFWRRPLVSTFASSVLAPVRHALAQAARARADGRAAPLSALEQRVLVGTPAAALEPEAEEFWAAHAEAGTPVTWAIFAVNAAMFALEAAFGSSESSGNLVRMGANVPALVRAGELWRLFSAAFLHVGFLHLAVNMWALRVLGPFLERVLGSSRFLLLYGGSALAGSVASAWFSRSPHSPSAGASGALWGLMVAGFALGLRPQGLIPDSVARVARRRGWQPLLVNTFISFAIPFIDFYAHFGGGLAGGALVLSGALTRDAQSPSRGVRLTAVAMGAAMALSIAIALWHGEPWRGGLP